MGLREDKIVREELPKTEDLRDFILFADQLAKSKPDKIGGFTLSRIAKDAGLPPSSFSLILQRLEDCLGGGELIAREARKGISGELTDFGKSILEPAREIVKQSRSLKNLAMTRLLNHPLEGEATKLDKPRVTSGREIDNPWIDRVRSGNDGIDQTPPG